MTLVERHSHRPHYPAMPYKYTPVSARLGPSSPPYPHTPHLHFALAFIHPLSFHTTFADSSWNDCNPDCFVRQPIHITETPAPADARRRCTYAAAPTPFGAYHTILFPFPVPTATPIFTATNCRPEFRASGGQRPRLRRAAAPLFLVSLVVATP